MKKSNRLCALMALAAFTAALPAAAAPELRMTAVVGAVSTTVELSDGALGDASSTAGWLTFVNKVGDNWMVTTTGVGSPFYPGSQLDLSSISVSNIGQGGTYLDIFLSDTGFSLSALPGLMNFLGSIGGTTQGMVTWEMFVDDSNTLFGEQQSIGSGTNSSAAFAGSVLNTAMVDGTFSMTLQVRINHGNGQKTTSFDFEGVGQGAPFSRLVPEPGTILLLGVGLLGLGLVRRRNA